MFGSVFVQYDCISNNNYISSNIVIDSLYSERTTIVNNIYSGGNALQTPTKKWNVWVSPARYHVWYFSTIFFRRISSKTAKYICIFYLAWTQQSNGVMTPWQNNGVKWYTGLHVHFINCIEVLSIVRRRKLLEYILLINVKVITSILYCTQSYLTFTSFIACRNIFISLIYNVLE